MSTTTDAAAALRPARTGSRFYLWLSVAYLVIAFGGFTPTYWAPVIQQRFDGGFIFHVHGLLLFSWTLLFFVQSALVSAQRINDHRSWGLAGIALFSLLMCSILVTQFVVLKRDAAAGYELQALRFAAVTLVGWPFMAVFFALAIANVARPERHKRYMTLLMILMMTPALARVVLLVVSRLSGGGGAGGAPPPPFVAIVPGLLGSLLLLTVIIYERRTRGSVHPIYRWGGLVAFAYPSVAALVARTDAWLGFARGFEHLAG
jgi:hypothetical protein